MNFPSSFSSLPYLLRDSVSAKMLLFLFCSLSTFAAEAPGPEKSPEAPTRVRHGSQGEVIVTLDMATQKLMGLRTEALSSAELKPEIKAFGRVLDTSPLTGLVAELVTAEASSAASQAELKRLQTLASQNNASERNLQNAQAAAARDQAQSASAHLRLLAGWGPVIANRNDLAAFVASLSSLTSALVQLDLPGGHSIREMPTSARILALSEKSHPIGAQFVSAAPMVDPQLQSQGFLFLVSSNLYHLTPGAAVTGYIAIPGDLRSGVLLPRSAVLQFNGAHWVYLQTSDTNFQRTQVALEVPLKEGWFLSGGFKVHDKVVTTGAQQLLSEEHKGVGGE